MYFHYYSRPVGLWTLDSQLEKQQKRLNLSPARLSLGLAELGNDGENSSPLMSLSVDRQKDDRLQYRRSCQLSDSDYLAELELWLSLEKAPHGNKMRHTSRVIIHSYCICEVHLIHRYCICEVHLIHRYCICKVHLLHRYCICE